MSMGFCRQEYWSGLPFPSPWIFPTQGLNLGFLHCIKILYHLSYREVLKGSGGEMIVITYDNNNIDEKEKGEKVKREGKENISTKYDIVEKKKK